jgi:protein involved in polysaccharide export with SLBB domain
VRNQSIVKNPVVVNEAVAIDSISDYLGNLYDEINWDYAVIERLNRKDLTVSLVPFSLIRAFADEKSKDNQLLQAGDIVTIFSVNDLSLPQSKRRLFVRVDGEVSEPGIYEVKNGATLKDLLRIAGGLTQDAYLFGAGLYREEIKKSQTENLKKLLARMESEASNEIGKISASSGASADSSALQIRVQAAQQAQRQALLNLRSIKPEGRVALGIPAELKISPGALPDIQLRNGDRFSIPPRPDYVYVYGAINSESALIFKPGSSVSDYLKLSGITESGDRDAAVLLRANGEALAKNNGSWFSIALSTTVMPGDSIIVPQKYDLEPFWSTFTRNTKDITQIFYQLGLGAAAIKTLRN